MSEIISKVIPILLLISLGYWMQYKKILTQETVDEIKKVVIYIALPSLLFITFITMEFKKVYFGIFFIVFILLGVFHLIGIGLNRIPLIQHPLLPFMTTGFTFGLLGVPLYGTVFGVENLNKITIFGIGHEVFMWLVFFTVLKMKFKKEGFSFDVVKGFLKSPIILSIAIGVGLNIAGFGTSFEQNVLLKGIYSTLQYLSSLATPLILIIVGFGLRFYKPYMKQSAVFLIIRMSVIFIVGYAFKYLWIDKVIPPTPLYNYAYFTFLVLPPPFSLPIFVGEYSTKVHKELANNTVVLGTVVSIILYIIFIILI